MIANIGKSVKVQEQEQLERELDCLVKMSRAQFTGLMNLAERACYV